MRAVPEFQNLHISEDGKKLSFVKDTVIINIQIENNIVNLKRNGREEYEKYFVWDLVALCYLGIPLDSYKISHKDGNENNNHHSNLKFDERQKDYNDPQILKKFNIEISPCAKFSNHRVTSDGFVLNIKTSCLNKIDYDYRDGIGRVTVIVKDNNKNKKFRIDELIADVFIKKPRNATKLIHINGLTRDNRRENLMWLTDDSTTESFKRESRFEYEKFNHNLDPGIKILKEEDTEIPNSNIDPNVQKKKSVKIKEISYYGDEDEDGEEGLEEVNENDVNIEEEVRLQPHDSIYEEFELSDVSFDLEHTFEQNGKLWKQAKYKKFVLKNFFISEDMQLYSKAIKGLVQDNAADMTITDDGEKIYRLSVDGKVKRTNLKDILASSFLKTPDNAVVAVYRNWNKDNSKGKYVGQRQHYTNIRWLTENDLIYIGNPEEKFLLSKLGDIYTFKMGWFRLIVETNSNFNLRRVMMRLKTTNSKGLASELANIHKLVGLYFVKRIDETYKYLVHKDGDLSNNHYRNLIWLKTLSGIHNDGVAYFEVPGCPDYVLSETNMPYSFKRGILSQLKIQMRGDGYYSLKLITKENKYCDFLYHRIVSATRNKDFDNKLVVDHGDRKRDNFQHTNLRAVTIKENNANSDPKRGKEIMQYDLKGNFMAKFPNSVTAAAVLGENFKGYNFSNCAKLNNNETGKTHTSEGFIWKYVINNKRYIPRQEETFRILRGVFQGKKIEYDNYMISNLGTVINVNNGYAKRITDSTYPYVNFSKNGKKKDKLIHFMVALLFVEGRTEEKCQVNHIDRNKKNFRFDNLEWVTPTENSLHSSYKNSLPVKKICMKTGDILGVYDSRKEGALSCGKTDASGIRKACNYKPLQSFGFYWEDVFEHELKNYPHLKINTEK